MRFSTSAIAATLLSTVTYAAPATEAPRAVAALSESSPWLLRHISIFESSNKTAPSTVSFDIKDKNSGLTFDTTCSRTVAKGETLYDNKLRSCGNSKTGLAWSLDTDKTIYIQRGYTDPAVGPPGQDYVTCFGNWQLNPHPFEYRKPQFTGPLLGTNYTQLCMEVYCTSMTA